jgi:hypothetical protein
VGVVRWGRIPGWLAGAVLPLAVCAGLLVMHALDSPARHSATPAVAATPHEHDHGVDGHTPGHQHRGVGDGLHCADCPGVVHVIVACLAVLATVGLATLSCRLRLAGSFVTAAGPWARSVARPGRPKVPRPAWVRLNVMLC